MDDFRRAINDRGWFTTSRVISDGEVEWLRREVAPYAIEGRGGARNLLELEFVRDLATRASIRDIATHVLGDGCFAVRAPLQWHARVA